MSAVMERHPRYTVVGWTRTNPIPPVARVIDGAEASPSALEPAIGKTLVPIEEAPKTQVKLFATDSEDAARQFIATYRGDLIGLHIIDNRVNPAR